MRPRKNYRSKPKSIRSIKESLYYNKGKGKDSSSDSDEDIWDNYQKKFKKKDTTISKKKKRSKKEENSKKKKSPEKVPYLKITATVLLVGAIIFFLVSVIVAVYVFLSGSFFVSGDNIIVNIEGPQTVSSGEEVNYDITVKNRNDVSLYDTKMIIRYPETARDTEGVSSRMPTERIDLGDLRADGVSRRKVAFDMFGKKGEVNNLVVELKYNIEGSGALFEKKKEFPIKVTDSPVALSFNGPQKTYLNSANEYSVILRSTSKEVLEDVRVRVEYPVNFRIIDSEEDMDRGVWKVDFLEP
ncbi:MAG: hypothetical protein ACQESA_02260, partial [Patescibacteria group bacterium]